MESKLTKHKNLIKTLYNDKRMGGVEIAEYLKREFGLNINARSVQRFVKANIGTRTVREALHAKWENLGEHPNARFWRAYRDYKEATEPLVKRSIGTAKRMKVLKRDGYRCVLCGATAETTVLNIDHIKPIAGFEGSKANDIPNLRTLCRECNLGLGLEHMKLRVKKFKSN